jgi:hypothetical protein
VLGGDTRVLGGADGSRGRGGGCVVGRRLGHGRCTPGAGGWPAVENVDADRRDAHAAPGGGARLPHRSGVPPTWVPQGFSLWGVDSYSAANPFERGKSIRPLHRRSGGPPTRIPLPYGRGSVGASSAEKEEATRRPEGASRRVAHVVHIRRSANAFRFRSCSGWDGPRRGGFAAWRSHPSPDNLISQSEGESNGSFFFPVPAASRTPAEVRSEPPQSCGGPAGRWPPREPPRRLNPAAQGEATKRRGQCPSDSAALRAISTPTGTRRTIRPRTAAPGVPANRSPSLTIEMTRAS